MAKFWLSAAVGLYLLQLCLAQISLNISCRYAGVFHVEKNRRYSLTREEAIELCKALNSTLPTWEQMEKAHSLGLETCRYGYIEEKIVLPRHNPYHLCAANATGIYVLHSNSNVSEQYDTFCFNSSETRDYVCDPVRELYSSWPDNRSIVDIINADGTKYIGGIRITEPPPVTDDDSSMGSGSANDRGTTDPSVIRSGGVFHTSFIEDASPFHPTDEVISLSPANPEDNLNHAVVSTSYVKHEDSTRDSLIHVVHSGWNNEGRYSANNTRNDTLPGTVSPGDGERYSTGKILELIKNIIVTAMSSSDSFLKQKVSTSHPQDGVHSGLEAEVAFPTNTTTDDLHQELVPSDEKQNNMEEAFHAAVFVNGSTKDEESHQDQLLSVGKYGRRKGGNSSTNRTSHGVVQILIPPSESDHENQSAQTDSNQDQLPWGSDGTSSQNEHEQESSDTALTSHDGSKHEDTFTDSYSLVDYSSQGTENMHLINNTIDDVLHPLALPSENEPSQKHITDEVSNDVMKHEESTQHPLTQRMDPDFEWDNEEQYSTNTSSEETLPGIIPTSENEHKNTSIYTAVLSSGNTYFEETAHDMIFHRQHSEWHSEDKYPTNTSSDNLLPESIPSVESEHENEPTHTVVITIDGTEHEVSIQDSPNHVTDPGWDGGDRHQANESTDNVVPGISFPAEHVHEKETLHTDITFEIHPTIIITAVDVTDETKHENVTIHPEVYDIQHEWSREEEYPTNSIKDEELATFAPPENNNEEKDFHTAVIHNNDARHEDATQKPLPPVHQPDWHMEEGYSTNTSRDDILMGSSANNGNEHGLHKDLVSHDGAKDDDSTPEPVKHDSEDKYSPNSTEGVLPAGIVPRRGTNHKNSTYHTGLDPNQSEGRGSQQGDSTPKPPSRVSRIPDWLIVVASLLALALILGVCIAVNSRRRCGQTQKLVINNGKGVVDNKNMGGLNGEASKSHEMVHLVHKEQPEDRTGSHDEFLQIDETNNLQEVDLKSGV
ncbi:CD44 antigen isoform X4 [Paroedura picta]|uniref:CD44 antigen isoform X4 n=1 Tax=Paroedura picta TaxID=143630 RepID=UPI00405620C1